jgi:3-dehydroquinate dehydratase/shikimate dehydrogenase
MRDLPDAVRLACEVADIVELRLDCLSQVELSRAADEIRAIRKSIDRPMILTLRTAEQGGRRQITAAERLDFRLQNSPSDVEYWDVELDLASALKQREQEGDDVVGMGLVDWARTICSHHDFGGVPADLDSIYEQMTVTKSRILKIAVQVDDAIDCLRLFKLLERSLADGREMIAIGMGDGGIMTRILGPSRGSFLTYGSLEEESATAPGQITARDLRDLYRIDQIDHDTRIFGIIGHPVSHSLSPKIQNAAFAAAKLNAVYIPFEVRDVVQFVRRMVRPKTRELDWSLGGLSVTAPHKSMVMQALDWIDPASREIGAVNTIVVQDDQLLGYNTDAAGFIAALRGEFNATRDAHCAVVGAGGAARACVWALKQEGALVTVFARDESKAEFVAESFDVSSRRFPPANFGGFDVVINAMPLGTRGEHEHETIATAEQLRGVRLAYDLVYNPAETRFLREAKKAGCKSLGGIEMLLAQAVEQFKLWTNTEPDLEAMRRAALRR